MRQLNFDLVKWTIGSPPKELNTFARVDKNLKNVDKNTNQMFSQYCADNMLLSQYWDNILTISANIV